MFFSFRQEKLAETLNFEENRPPEVPKHEWDTILQFHQTTLIALKEVLLKLSSTFGDADNESRK